MRVEENDEYCVTCPKCGRIIQKAYITDSTIKCSRCGYHFYIRINQGVSICMDAEKFGVLKNRETLLQYAKALEGMHQG